ncbi:MAG: hypothetical protein ACM336_00520 [Acidobacteriota bacterium]
MRPRLLGLMLVAGAVPLFAGTHVAIGVQIGRPAPVVVAAPVVVPAPPPVVAYRPPCPGPGYVWIGGYYDAYGVWYDGYWAMPPYAGAYWIAPRHIHGHFYSGYWNGPRGIYRGPGHRYVAPPAYRHGHGWYDRGHGRYDHGFRGHDRHDNGRRGRR